MLEAVDEIAKLAPSFISVTYGAGGGTSKNTVKIASHIQNDLGVDSIAHLTCVSSTKDEVRQRIEELKEQGIQNILALRGDIPQDASFPISVEFSIEFFCLAISFAFLAWRTFHARHRRQIMKNDQGH